MSNEKPLPPGVILQRDGKKFLNFYCETAQAKKRTSRFVKKIGIQTIKEKLGLDI